MSNLVLYAHPALVMPENGGEEFGLLLRRHMSHIGVSFETSHIYIQAPEAFASVMQAHAILHAQAERAHFHTATPKVLPWPIERHHSQTKAEEIALSRLTGGETRGLFFVPGRNLPSNHWAPRYSHWARQALHTITLQSPWLRSAPSRRVNAVTRPEEYARVFLGYLLTASRHRWYASPINHRYFPTNQQVPQTFTAWPLLCYAGYGSGTMSSSHFRWTTLTRQPTGLPPTLAVTRSHWYSTANSYLAGEIEARLWDYIAAHEPASETPTLDDWHHSDRIENLLLVASARLLLGYYHLSMACVDLEASGSLFVQRDRDWIMFHSLLRNVEGWVRYVTSTSLNELVPSTFPSLLGLAQHMMLMAKRIWNGERLTSILVAPFTYRGHRCQQSWALLTHCDGQVESPGAYNPREAARLAAEASEFDDDPDEGDPDYEADQDEED